MIVLDASVALAWCFADEQSPLADAVADLLTTDRAVVPAIWPLEVGNALLSAERGDRLAAAERPALLRLLGALPIEIEPLELAQVVGPVTDLARESGLSVCDAAYLELASRLRAPLATLDQRLADSARRLGIGAVVGHP